LDEKHLHVVNMIAQVNPYKALNMGAAMRNYSLESQSKSPNKMVKIP